jgi:hypothetical protein
VQGQKQEERHDSKIIRKVREIDNGLKSLEKKVQAKV